MIILWLYYIISVISINFFCDRLSFVKDDDGELHENQLPRTLLLMHRWYVSSTELAGKLLIIYPVAVKYEWVCGLCVMFQ